MTEIYCLVFAPRIYLTNGIWIRYKTTSCSNTEQIKRTPINDKWTAQYFYFSEF